MAPRTHSRTTPEHARALLEFFGGNATQAAAAANLHPSTIQDALRNGDMTERASRLCEFALLEARMKQAAQLAPPEPDILIVHPPEPIAPPAADHTTLLVVVPTAKLNFLTQVISSLGGQSLVE